MHTQKDFFVLHICLRQNFPLSFPLKKKVHCTRLKERGVINRISLETLTKSISIKSNCYAKFLFIRFFFYSSLSDWEYWFFSSFREIFFSHLPEVIWISIYQYSAHLINLFLPGLWLFNKSIKRFSSVEKGDSIVDKISDWFEINRLDVTLKDFLNNFSD